MIRCENLTKKYRWYEREDSLKSSFAKAFKKRGKIWEWEVLNGITFHIKKGEAVGIIGKNGSGKSTLLKLVCGIYAPNSGSITTEAKRRLALIELGAGFYPDLTGRDNIKLNWAFNNLPKMELKEKFNDIVDFSGVGDFLDTPLKYYSSGMTARLGFSVAIHADPDLLIIDEILAVGDLEFQEKCYGKIEEFKRKDTTILFVSHSQGDLQRVCERGIFLDKGRVQYDGPIANALTLYNQTYRTHDEVLSV
ncbi:MAG TPA: ABC transporter ATP-binding protein [Ignavibacteriales bacterium]|nr:ABC transporter ATP-binding protein [Ignavibacteriales bacterium]